MWKVRQRTYQESYGADLLYSFSIEQSSGCIKGTLKRETRYYVKLMFMTREDGIEGIEVIADSKPCIKFHRWKSLGFVSREQQRRSGERL